MFAVFNSSKKTNYKSIAKKQKPTVENNFYWVYRLVYIFYSMGMNEIWQLSIRNIGVCS